jgi:hypothetical protein
MGTGSYVNFGNGDDAFNIALDSAGHLNFLANDQGGSGSLRMAILEHRDGRQRPRRNGAAEERRRRRHHRHAS